MADSKADQSCLACKKLKRKCDKQLPACALCSRTRRSCEYPDDAALPVSAPTAANFAALQARLNDVESRLALSNKSSTSDPPSIPASRYAAESSSLSPLDHDVLAETLPRDFPASLFLDIQCFKWFGVRLPKRSTSIPAVCLDAGALDALPLPGTAIALSTG